MTINITNRKYDQINGFDPKEIEKIYYLAHHLPDLLLGKIAKQENL